MGNFYGATGGVILGYLIVGGGGGGGSDTNFSGGGGAGGLLSGTFGALVGTSYPIVVGSGGTPNNNGTDSSLNSLTAVAFVTWSIGIRIRLRLGIRE
jgi:hypothetical protein